MIKKINLIAFTDAQKFKEKFNEGKEMMKVAIPKHNASLHNSKYLTSGFVKRIRRYSRVIKG